MIDLTKAKDPVRILRNALQPNINNRGDWILYHVGDYADGVHHTPLGRAVYEAAMRGEVAPVQKLVSKEPRQYNYYARIL